MKNQKITNNHATGYEFTEVNEKGFGMKEFYRKCKTLHKWDVIIGLHKFAVWIYSSEEQIIAKNQFKKRRRI